jgi:hypothetical protein
VGWTQVEIILLKALWSISKSFVFPILCQIQEDIFLWSSPWEPVEQVPGGKAQNSMGVPDGWISGDFKLVYIQPPAVCQLQFRFSYPVLSPVTVAAVGFCSRKLWLFVFPFQSLIFTGNVCPVTFIILNTMFTSF